MNLTGGRPCPGPPGRLSALSISLCKSVLYGIFVWARRALNSQKRRFPARAVPNEHFDSSAGRNFVVGPNPMSQVEALQYCKQQGGDLASIHSALEQETAFKACSAAVGDTSDHDAYGNEEAKPHGCIV